MYKSVWNILRIIIEHVFLIIKRYDKIKGHTSLYLQCKTWTNQRCTYVGYGKQRQSNTCNMKRKI